MSNDFYNNRWEDYQLLGKSRNTGPTLPTEAARSGGCYMWRLDTVNHTLYAAAQMPHAWNGLTIKPHVHWEPRTTATYTGAFEMGYIWSNIAPTSVINTVVQTAVGSFNFSGVLGKITETNLTDITLVSPSPSAVLQCYLKLSAFTAGTGCWLWGWDFHYQRNRPGTINPSSNP